MPTEVLLYGQIYDESAAEFISQINEVPEGEELVVRVNTPGGSVDYGNGMIAKFQEYEGRKRVKVDGAAYSMGFNFALYADEVEALDVSDFMIHRAAYPSWYEESFMSEAEKTSLVRTNKNLEKAFRNKVDVKAFEELSGTKVKALFSMDDRVDVYMSAQDAKKIGLVDKINQITPKRRREIKDQYNGCMAKAASAIMDGSINLPKGFKPELVKPEEATVKDEFTKEQIEEQNNNNNMTLQDLKAKHPELFQEAYDMGVSAEKDRVESWLVFAAIDPDKVKEGIESGESVSAKQTQEFVLKSSSQAALAALQAEAPASTTTDEPVTTEKTAKEKEIEDIDAKLQAKLGLKKD